jgi:histidyl-tRNA synthetase
MVGAAPNSGREPSDSKTRGSIRVAVGPTAAAMTPQPIQRVRGTNDFGPADDAVLRLIEANLRDYFALFGYRGVSTPIIEDVDLFLRKSGEEIAARTYAFSHWNRRLCLRPELTAPVMRAYINHMQAQPLPLRLHYAGPTFRYEKPQRGRYRQFTQVGLECIGGDGPSADAEVLAAACGGARRVGIEEFRLTVGHLGVVLSMLQQMEIGDHGKALILGFMEQIARRGADLGEVRDRILGLMGVGNSDDDEPESAGSLVSSLLLQFGRQGASDVAADLLARANLALEGGSRGAGEIVERLLEKAARPDPSERIERALTFIRELHELAGPPEAVFGPVERLLSRYELAATPLIELRRTLELYRQYEVATPEMTVDLSLGRGLRYYTGIVFELHHGAAGPASQICGGGRYDDLVRALGGREAISACGFSFGLERVKMAIDATGSPLADRIDALVVPVGAEDEPTAIGLAQELRNAGMSVELDLRRRGVRANLRHADRHDIAHVVIWGERERETGRALVHDMESRTETHVSRGELAMHIRESE